MDSMRHLSTSLPNARRRQDELLPDFRAAALSVTNLYKAAAASQEKARAAGYQDALDDLLAFLDKENLGLMDGEGWRVRRWATERLSDDTSSGNRHGSDEEEEAEHTEQRSSSPEVQRKPAPAVPTTSSDIEDSSPHRAPNSEPPRPPSTALTVPSLDEFSYRSQHPYPATNHGRDNSNMELDNTISNPSSTETVRVRARPKHTSHARRGNNGSTINLNLGAGAGSKRKIPYPDFFDISGVHPEGQQDKKDGSGGRGGKRGRHV